jgi:hypothetical protein
MMFKSNGFSFTAAAQLGRSEHFGGKTGKLARGMLVFR